MNNTFLLFYSPKAQTEPSIIFNISKMAHLLRLAINHGTFTFVNILLCTSFKDFQRSFYNNAQGSFARLLLVQFAGNERKQ